MKKETARKVEEVKISALDTETGGLNPQTDGLVSIAIAPPKEPKGPKKPNLKPLSLLLEYNKSLNYDHKALEVNGFYPIQDKQTNEFFWWQTINGKRVCTKGMPEKQALEATLTYMEVYLKDSFIAGVNIEFDKAFLHQACKRIDTENNKTKADKDSFCARLENCLLRKTIELQTLALCAHIQGVIKLPYTNKGFRRPSVSLNSIAKAVSEKTPSEAASKRLERTTEYHDALEDATLTLNIAETLTKPWNLQEKKKEIIDSPTPTII